MIYPADTVRYPGGPDGLTKITLQQISLQTGKPDSFQGNLHEPRKKFYDIAEFPCVVGEIDCTLARANNLSKKGECMGVGTQKKTFLFGKHQSCL